MLKYKEETRAITVSSGTACPPATATGETREAWRWTFNPFSDNCFLPVAKRNPMRLNRAEAAEEQCSCWALSMHRTDRESISAFQALERSFKRARQTLGTHLATAVIDASHGLSTAANAHGHFDLHPFRQVNFESVFKVVDAIPPARRRTEP